MTDYETIYDDAYTDSCCIHNTGPLLHLGPRTIDHDAGLAAVVAAAKAEARSASPIVCICGSTRFRAEMTEANRSLTMQGYIVLAPGVFGHDGDPLTEFEKSSLDLLHFKKIALSDRVYVVNPGNYIGNSTRQEIAYARSLNKTISYSHNPDTATQ